MMRIFNKAENMISKLFLAQERLNLDFLHWGQLSDLPALEDVGESLHPSLCGLLHTGT